MLLHGLFLVPTLGSNPHMDPKNTALGREMETRPLCMGETLAVTD